MANYPQELAQDAVCQSHTGHMTGLWFLPARPLRLNTNEWMKVKVKWSRYRHGVAQRVGRDITLFFHDRGTRRWWVVSSTPRPHFTPEKDPVPILQEAGWAQGPVWRGGKSRPHRYSIPVHPARSQSLYRLSYPAHKLGGGRYVKTQLSLYLLFFSPHMKGTAIYMYFNSIHFASRTYY